MDYSFSSDQRAAYQAFGDLLADKLPLDDLLAAPSASAAMSSAAEDSTAGQHSAETALLRLMAADGWLELLCPAEADWQPGDLVGAVHVLEQLGRIPTSNLTLHLIGFVLPLVRALAPDQLPAVIALIEAGKLVSAAVPDQTAAGQFRYSAAIDQNTGAIIAPVPASRTPVVIAADRVDAVIVPVRSGDGTWSLGLIEPGDQARRTDAHRLDLSAPADPLTVLTPGQLPRPLPGGPHLGTGTDLGTGTGTGLAEQEFQAGIDKAMRYYLLSLGAQAVGGGAELTRRTVEYVSQRKQFGRPIASFQALRHIVADMALLVENSRAMLYETAWRVAGRPADSGDYVAAARVYTAGSYVKVAESAIQCFGGIGFTWEGGVHAWYRNALANTYYLSDVHLASQLLEHQLAS